MARQRLRASTFPGTSSAGGCCSRASSDAESDSAILTSLRSQAVHLLGWTIFACTCYKLSHLPFCLLSSSIFDLNFFAGSVEQLLPHENITPTSIFAHSSCFSILLCFFKCTSRIAAISAFLFQRQPWHLAVPRSLLSM